MKHKPHIFDNMPHCWQHYVIHPCCQIFYSLLLLGTELPLMVKGFGLLDDIFPFPSILNTSQIFY